MGFRSGAYCNVWSTETVTDKITKCRLTIGHRDKETSEFVQEFSGFVSFVGTAAAGKAAKLKEGDRIRLGDVDVTTRYFKETGVTYTNFNCYSFEIQEDRPYDDPRPAGVDSGEVDEENLPY